MKNEVQTLLKQRYNVKTRMQNDLEVLVCFFDDNKKYFECYLYNKDTKINFEYVDNIDDLISEDSYDVEYFLAESEEVLSRLEASSLNFSEYKHLLYNKDYVKSIEDLI